MAITAVPSSAVAQESPARVSSPAESERREAAPIAKPSVIARISPEGRQLAAQEQQQVAAPADKAVQAAPSLESRASAQPQRRTAAEEANDAAQAVALTAQVPNVALARPVTPASKADSSSDSPVASVVAIPRDAQQPVQPVPAAKLVASPSEVNNAPPAVQRENRAAAPVNAQQNAPTEANVAPKASPPAPAPEKSLDAVRLSQTAKDFVAALNASQSTRAQVQERAAPVRQAQESNAAELRAAPPRSAVELSAAVTEAAPRPEAGSARFDTSTFAVGVERNRTAETQRSSQAEAVAVAAPNASSDTGRLVRQEVRGETSQPQAVAGNAVASSTSTSSSERRVQSTPQVATSQDPATRSAAQNGPAKHLNVLANLLTP